MSHHTPSSPCVWPSVGIARLSACQSPQLPSTSLKTRYQGENLRARSSCSHLPLPYAVSAHLGLAQLSWGLVCGRPGLLRVTPVPLPEAFGVFLETLGVANGVVDRL